MRVAESFQPTTRLLPARTPASDAAHDKRAGGGGSYAGSGVEPVLPPGAAVSIVPAGLNLDTVHSMSLETMPANSRFDVTLTLHHALNCTMLSNCIAL